MNPSVRIALLCSCLYEAVLNSLTVRPEPRLRMPRVHIVLVSVHSSSHLFVPFLATQCLRNTLRKVLSFLFLTDFLTGQGVKSQSDRLLLSKSRIIFEKELLAQISHLENRWNDRTTYIEGTISFRH